MLRNVIGSTIPIELYHFPDELEDEAERNELESKYDLKLISIGGRRYNMEKSWSEFCDVFVPRTGADHIDIKLEAFLATKFTEFIYLDSVSRIVRNTESSSCARTTFR